MRLLFERIGRLLAWSALIAALVPLFRKPRVPTVTGRATNGPSSPLGRPPSEQPRSARRPTLLVLLLAGVLGSALLAESSSALPGDDSLHTSSAAGVDLPPSFLSFGNRAILAPRFQQDPRIAARLAARPPFIWPVDGWITDFFSADHAGVDIGVEYDQPVHAARAGAVTFAGGDSCCGKGLFVVLEHDDGWTTVYGHLSDFRVEVGTKVKQGTVIGISGNTGHSTGPHVHMELHLDGYAVDPMLYFPPDIEIRLEPDATETPTETGTPVQDLGEAETPTPNRPGQHQPTERPATTTTPLSATTPPPPPTPATPEPTAASPP